MRDGRDALLSLQQYVAGVLAEPWQILTDLEDETAHRPYALVTEAGELTVAGRVEVPELSQPFAIAAYPEPGETVQASRDAAHAVATKLARAFTDGVGNGRPERVPLYDYDGRPEIDRVTVDAATGTFTVAVGAGDDQAVAGPVVFGATARQLQDALRAEGVAVTVDGRRGGPWLLHFPAGAPQTVAVSASDGDASVERVMQGSPDPWRRPIDYLQVADVAVRTAGDPQDARLRSATVAVTLSWARRLPPQIRPTLDRVDYRLG